MATFTMMLILMVLSLAIFPWIMTKVQQNEPHHIDMMAGDEGED